MNCYQCHQPLIVSIIKRKNGSFTGVCKSCKLNHAIKYDDQNNPFLVNVQKRFSFGGAQWHATYRTETNETTFVEVKKRPKSLGFDQPVFDRQEIKLSNFIELERFINLLSFL